MVIWRLAWAFLLCALGTTIGVMAASSPSLLGYSELGSSGVPIWAFFSLPLVMLAGIVAYGIRIQLDRLPDSEDEVDHKTLLAKVFKSGSFVRAIVVSPIVFLGAYVLIKDQPDLILSHLIAFENGFFWQAVLIKKDRENRNQAES